MRTATVLLALVMPLAACGSIAENVGERIAEEAIEAGIEGGGEVDFDVDGDGGIRVETSDGEMAFGAAIDVPADWPDEVVFLDGITLQSAFSESGEDSTTYSWTGMAEGGFEDVVADLESSLTGQGYEVESNFDSASDGTRSASRTFVKGDSRVTLSVTEDASVEGGVAVFYTGEIAG